MEGPSPGGAGRHGEVDRGLVHFHLAAGLDVPLHGAHHHREDEDEWTVRRTNNHGQQDRTRVQFNDVS